MRLWRSLVPSLVIVALPLLGLGAQAPAGSTGKCADGSYTKAATKRGACSHHGGVAEWYGTVKVPSATSRADSATGKTGAASTAGTKVWVNTPTMVYHCPGTRWYGATKKGSYMTESAAKAAGARPANGKSCS
jgi:hypothetical protein